MKRSQSLFIVACLAFANGAFASGECSRINNQLIVIESAIQSTRLPKCDEERKDFCCDPENPLTCKTFLELHTKQNELMGKLVVHEGLVAIGKAIEADHSSIQKLEVKELRQARDKVDSFLTGYRKAALLNASLEADFWVDESGTAYEGQLVEDLQAHLEKQCARDDEEIKKFCAQIEKARQEDGVDYGDIFISLAEFARADAYGRLSPADRISDYERYQKALELRVGGELVSYENGHEQIEKIVRLRSLLAEPEKGISEEKAQEILSIAKNLDGVEVNYGEMVRPRPEFKDFFDSKIATSLASFNQASRALLEKDKMLANMDKLEQTMANHRAAAMTSIEQNVKDKTSCDQSSTEALLACFKRECAQTVTGECSQAGDPRKAQSLHSLNRQIKALEDYSSLESKIAKAKACLKSPVMEQESAECVENLRQEIALVSQDEVDNLRKQLHETEAAMEMMNRAGEVYDLKLSKAMGLAAYRNKGCLYESNKVKVNDFGTVCSRQEIFDYSQEAVRLMGEAGKIVEFGQNPFVNENLEIPARNYLAYKNAFLRRCEESRGDEVLCDMYESDKALNGEAARKARAAARRLLAAKTAARRLPSKDEVPTIEEPDLAEAFVAGLATSVATTGVQVFATYQQNEMRHDSMMRYHQNRLSFLRSNYDWQKNNSTINYTYHPYTNYGLPLYDYNAAGQFGGQSGATYYRYPENYNQFSFAPAAVIEPYGTQNFTAPAANTGSEGFSFGQ